MHRLPGHPSSACVECAWTAGHSVLTAPTTARGSDELDDWVAKGCAVPSAMGVRNATVRHIAVPDLTTTVLTMTLTLTALRPSPDSRAAPAKARPAGSP